MSRLPTHRSLLRALPPLAVTMATLLLGARPTLAQDPDPLARLDATSRYAIEVVLDSARTLGLPTRPLLNRAQLGVAKHIDGRRIATAVRRLFVSLREARSVLGPSMDETELGAAASVLEAGAPAAVLTRFRPTRAGAGAKAIAVPLVILADLITRGVPIDTASTAIVQMWQHGATENDFNGLWRGVEQDILNGQNPGTALQQRVREFPVRAPPGGIPQQPDPESSAP